MESDQKARFDELNAKLDRVIDAMATKEEVQNLQNEVGGLREEVRKLTTAVENLVKLVTALQTEYAAIKMQMLRYDRWFKEIAEKVGIQLKS